jgi:hypothetical protein
MNTKNINTHLNNLYLIAHSKKKFGKDIDKKKISIVKKYYKKKYQFFQKKKILKKNLIFLKKTNFFTYNEVFKIFLNKIFINFNKEFIKILNTNKNIKIFEIGAASKKIFSKYHNHENISHYYISDIINLNKYSEFIYFDINSYKDKVPSNAELIISVNVFHLAKNFKKTLDYLHSFPNIKKIIFTLPSVNMIEIEKGYLLNPLYVYCADIGLKINFLKDYTYYYNEINKTSFKLVKFKKIYYDNYLLGFYFEISK